MNGGFKALSIEFDPLIVEEAVLRAVETLPPAERAPFRRERNAVYDIGDPEFREQRFGQLHGEWFQRLGLAIPLVRLLEEHPRFSLRAGSCKVLLARAAREESADLYGNGSRGVVQSGALPAIVIRLCPATLLDEHSLSSLLRHELGHIDDMLDPEFGYDPDIPDSGTAAWFDNLVRARYHVLWDARIDGRLVASGCLPPEVEEIRHREFAAAFPMLAPDVDSAFRRFFQSSNLTDEQLLEFARNPHRLT